MQRLYEQKSKPVRHLGMIYSNGDLRTFFFIVVANRQVDLPVDSEHVPLMLHSTELNKYGMTNTIYRDLLCRIIYQLNPSLLRCLSCIPQERSVNLRFIDCHVFIFPSFGIVLAEINVHSTASVVRYLL